MKTQSTEGLGLQNQQKFYENFNKNQREDEMRWKENEP